MRARVYIIVGVVVIASGVAGLERFAAPARTESEDSTAWIDVADEFGQWSQQGPRRTSAALIILGIGCLSIAAGKIALRRSEKRLHHAVH